MAEPRPFDARYARSSYEHVVTYEFLLPLTQELKMRQALDELFFRDSLEERIREVGVDFMAGVIPRDATEPEEVYVARVATEASELIRGYSISHVNGRFRAADLATRRQAADFYAENRDYLVDETTALVRFTIPCPSSRIEHGAGFDLERESGTDEACRADDVRKIRGLFFSLFAETLVENIQGEAVIWVMETSDRMRLYAWEKQP